MLQTITFFPRMNVGFARTSCSVAPNGQRGSSCHASRCDITSSWRHCTMSLQWTHCVGFLTSRRTSTGADPEVVYCWNVRRVEFRRRGSDGGAGETDTELCGCLQRRRQHEFVCFTFLHWFSTGWRHSGSVSATACCLTSQGFEGYRTCSMDVSVLARGGHVVEIWRVQAAPVPPEARSKLWWRMVQGVAKLIVVEDVEKGRRPVAGAWCRHQ